MINSIHLSYLIVLTHIIYDSNEIIILYFMVNYTLTG